MFELSGDDERNNRAEAEEQDMESLIEKIYEAATEYGWAMGVAGVEREYEVKLGKAIDAALTRAYSEGRGDQHKDHQAERLAKKPEAAGEGHWIAIAERPTPRDGESFLVTNGRHVVPHIRGVIHNNTGSPWDWNYGESITHWMPLPSPPAASGNAPERSDQMNSHVHPVFEDILSQFSPRRAA